MSLNTMTAAYFHDDDVIIQYDGTKNTNFIANCLGIVTVVE